MAKLTIDPSAELPEGVASKFLKCEWPVDMTVSQLPNSPDCIQFAVDGDDHLRFMFERSRIVWGKYKPEFVLEIINAGLQRNPR